VGVARGEAGGAFKLLSKVEVDHFLSIISERD
jgi:hypothetical protein